MNSIERAECLVFNHDLTLMLNPSEDGKEVATRLIAEAIDAAVKEATDPLQAECDDLGGIIAGLREDKETILAIARELAAKHMRGNQCCTFCGAPPYMQAWTHADGCAVKRLQDLERGEPGR